ncbi:MAG: UbiA family prenyltransferase [Pseudomonadota bacterium]
MHKQPLIVDLDGTLVRTDTLMEVFVATLFVRPFAALKTLLSLFGGRARFKRRLTEEYRGDAAATLPYRDDLLAFLKVQKTKGRSLHLVSAADERIVAAVSDHVALFDSWAGSDGARNLKGSTKARYLQETFPDGFAYAGDSLADVAVWRAADEIIIASEDGRVHKSASSLGKPVAAAFRQPQSTVRTWVRACRLHQWSKNTLLVIPAILGGLATDLAVMGTIALGFVAIGLVASGTYILNDLADLNADRLHPTKRRRPFASGALPIVHGLLAAPLMVGAGVVIGLLLEPMFAAVLALYCALTIAYSLRLKRVVLLDAVIIAGLFTLRLVMGVLLAGVAWSAWLLTFAMFFFLSLALAKRHVEIKGCINRGLAVAPGRGYQADDAPLTLTLGIANAVASVQVLVLYLVFEAMPNGLYSSPAFLWVVPLGVALWAMRIWVLAHRGLLDDDPVVFALKDVLSLALGCAVAVGLALAMTA